MVASLQTNESIWITLPVLPLARRTSGVFKANTESFGKPSLMPINIGQRDSEMSEKRSENLETGKSIMGSVSEAAILIRRIAEPRPVGDSVKSAIRRAAHRLGWHWGRAKSVWYQEARRIDAHEMDALRQQAHIYAQIAARLSHIDPDFHCDDIAAFEYAAGQIGNVARSRTDGE
jgi:hypothetical protein